MYTKIIIKNFLLFFNIIYKMSGKNINFDDKKIKRNSFYNHKKINNIEDIDINNILVSKKEPFGTKNSHKYLLDIMKMIILYHYV